jgi:hypothetical protein
MCPQQAKPSPTAPYPKLDPARMHTAHYSRTIQKKARQKSASTLHNHTMPPCCQDAHMQHGWPAMILKNHLSPFCLPVLSHCICCDRMTKDINPRWNLNPFHTSISPHIIPLHSDGAATSTVSFGKWMCRRMELGKWATM